MLYSLFVLFGEGEMREMRSRWEREARTESRFAVAFGSVSTPTEMDGINDGQAMFLCVLRPSAVVF